MCKSMAKWFGVHFNQEVGFSSAVQCKKGPQALTSLLNHTLNYYYYHYEICKEDS